VINKSLASLYCNACSTPFSRGIGICENKKYRGVCVRYMPRASCPGCSGGGEDNKRRACNTSLKFEYLHRKRRCKMLIGGDDISINVITPWYVYIRPLFRFALIGLNLTAKSTGRATGELNVEFKFQICSRKLLLPFPPHRQSAPESLLAGIVMIH